MASESHPNNPGPSIAVRGGCGCRTSAASSARFESGSYESVDAFRRKVGMSYSSSLSGRTSGKAGGATAFGGC